MFGVYYQHGSDTAFNGGYPHHGWLPSFISCLVTLQNRLDWAETLGEKQDKLYHDDMNWSFEVY